MNAHERLVTDPGPVDESWRDAPVPRGRHAAPMTLERKLLELDAANGPLDLTFRGRHSTREVPW